MSNWLPIKTARTDGSPILVCDARDEDCQHVVTWDASARIYDNYPGGWRISHDRVYPPDQFTHWQPLLEPPHWPGPWYEDSE